LVVIPNRSIHHWSDEITNIKPVGIECTALINAVELSSLSPTGTKA